MEPVPGEAVVTPVALCLPGSAGPDRFPGRVVEDFAGPDGGVSQVEFPSFRDGKVLGSRGQSAQKHTREYKEEGKEKPYHIDEFVLPEQVTKETLAKVE